MSGGATAQDAVVVPSPFSLLANHYPVFFYGSSRVFLPLIISLITVLGSRKGRRFSAADPYTSSPAFLA